MNVINIGELINAYSIEEVLNIIEETIESRIHDKDFRLVFNLDNTISYIFRDLKYIFTNLSYKYIDINFNKIVSFETDCFLYLIKPIREYIELGFIYRTMKIFDKDLSMLNRYGTFKPFKLWIKEHGTLTEKIGRLFYSKQKNQSDDSYEYFYEYFVPFVTRFASVSNLMKNIDKTWIDEFNKEFNDVFILVGYEEGNLRLQFVYDIERLKRDALK